ncbi:MAG: pantetheine-phosphate adenylyltransferase [Muribaculaceae bacterium]|nr:pantetheine-phosphate adenylyltransferase [Muribaculaceae bacterium]
MTAKSISPDIHIHKGKRSAIFAGSFNPFTVGHASIVERGLALFDHIVIAIGVNAHKHHSDAVTQAANILQQYSGNSHVSVIVWPGLMVDLARQLDIHFFLRGVRSVADYEYERNMADVNRRLAGVETVLLFSLPEHGAISSSVVRELQSYGADVSDMLP